MSVRFISRKHTNPHLPNFSSFPSIPFLSYIYIFFSHTLSICEALSVFFNNNEPDSRIDCSNRQFYLLLFIASLSGENSFFLYFLFKANRLEKKIITFCLCELNGENHHNDDEEDHTDGKPSFQSCSFSTQVT